MYNNPVPSQPTPTVNNPYYNSPAINYPPATPNRSYSFNAMNGSSNGTMNNSNLIQPPPQTIVPSSSSSSRPPNNGNLASPLAGIEAANQAVANVNAALMNMFNQHPPTAPVVTANTSSPRIPRAPKDNRSAPKDIYIAPTPSIVVQGGDIMIPSGPAMVQNQAFVSTRTGTTIINDSTNSSSTMEQKNTETKEEYMYSLAASGDQLAELNEARVLAETKVRELEKKLKQVTTRSSILEADLEAAYGALDGRESELRRLRQLERNTNKRPTLLTALTGNLSAALLNEQTLQRATSSSTVSSLPANLAPFLPYSSIIDRHYIHDLVRRLPFLQALPESVIWEILHQSNTHVLTVNTTASTLPTAKDSVLLIIEGTMLFTGNNNNNPSTTSTVVIGPGDYLCEHTLLNRPPRLGRDPSLWIGKSEVVTIVALPSTLIRRFLLSECALLDSWGEASLATMLSHTYSPLRPPPRMHLHADNAYSAVVAHASLHRSLLHIATGGHIIEALVNEKLAFERKQKKANSNGLSSLMDNDDSDDDESSNTTNGKMDDDDLLMFSQGAAARASASIPSHLAQNAPLLLHMLPAHSGNSLERSLELLVQAACRFFGCTGVALFEIDDYAKVQHQQGRNSSKGATTAPAPYLVPRIVPASVSSILNRGLPLTGTPGVCANTGNTINILSTFQDSTFNASVEPVAGPLKPASVLCVPVYLSVPLSPHTMGERRQCGVLQLIDKRINTTTYFPPSQLRDDELSMFTESAALLRNPNADLQLSGKSSNKNTSNNSNNNSSSTSPVDYPGAICIGSDYLPRYPFTQRDIELTEVITRRMGELLTSALQQAMYASSNMGSNHKHKHSSSVTTTSTIPTTIALNPHVLSEPLREDKEMNEVPGLDNNYNDNNDDAASTPSTDDTNSIITAAANIGAGRGILHPNTSILGTRTVPLHTVTDLLQWRVRSLHAFTPLSLLASPLAVSQEEAAMGYTNGPKYPPPSTALLNGGQDDEDNNPVHQPYGSPGMMNMGGGGGGPYASSHGPDEFGIFDTATLNPQGDTGTASAVPTSVYVYVRACVVVGRLPITPDTTSPSARAINGPAAGRLGNGVSANDTMNHYTTSGGSVGAFAEGCSANWGIGCNTVTTNNNDNTLNTNASKSNNNSKRNLSSTENNDKENNNNNNSTDPSYNSTLLVPPVTEDIPDGKGWMDIEVRVCDLPKDSRIIFAVHEEDSEGEAGRPLFWSSCPLFTSTTGTLRTGRTLLPLHAGPWPGSVPGSGDDDTSGRYGVLEIDIGSVGIAPGTIVIDCELARGGRWWRGLVAAAGLSIDSGTNESNFDYGVNSGMHVGPGSVLLSPSKPSSISNNRYEESMGTGPYGEPNELIIDTSIPSLSNFSTTSRFRENNTYNEDSTSLTLRDIKKYEGGNEGVDARSMAPSLPTLQSGRPVFPFPPASNKASSLSKKDPFQTTVTAAYNMANSKPISPGVDTLSMREVQLLRNLKEGKFAADVWYPLRLSSSLRRMLWIYRKPLLQSNGLQILPLILRSAPFLHHVPVISAGTGSTAINPYSHYDLPGSMSLDPSIALRISHSLVRSAGKLPLSVTLQLLDATFTDSTLRNIAFDHLLAGLYRDITPSPSLQPFGTASVMYSMIPTLAILSITEPNMNSSSIRSLLCAAVEAPLSIGRQLVWMWRSLLVATPFRSRATRLIRSYLDIADEYATGEVSLQSYALSQIATACRRGTLPYNKGNRTQAVRTYLNSLVLPHTIRLPLKPHDPIIPSLYYRAMTNGTLDRALQRLLDEALGNTNQNNNNKSGTKESTKITKLVVSPTEERTGHSNVNRDGTATGTQDRGKPRTSGTIKLSPVQSTTSNERSTSPHPVPNDDDDNDDDDIVSDSDDEENNHRTTDNNNNNNPDDDEDDEDGESELAGNGTRRRGIGLIQDIEDAMALSLVLLGVYSDAPAFGLTPDIAANPIATLKTLRAAALNATASAAKVAGISIGSTNDSEIDPRLPLAGSSIRATVSNPSIDMGGCIAPSLPFTASVAAAVATAKLAEEITAPVEADADMILARYRAAIATDVQSRPPPPRPKGVVPPVPTGTGLPIAGLCVNNLLTEACRVLYSNTRRRYSRTLLVFKAAPEMDERRPGVLGGIMGASPNTVVPLPIGSAHYPNLLRIRSYVPRPIRFRENLIHILNINGDDTVIAVENMHASILNMVSRMWRENGMTIGDFAAPYVYGVHYVTSRDPLVVNAVTAAAGLGLGSSTQSLNSGFVGGHGNSTVNNGALALNGTAGESVGGRISGFLVTPPFTRTIAEILNVGEDETIVPTTMTNDGYPPPYISDNGTVIDDSNIVGSTRGGIDGGGRGGYNTNGLQRWFMSNLFNRFAGNEGNNNNSSSSTMNNTTVAQEMEQGGQYTAIVRTFLHSLASIIVSSYILALGPRKPADLLLTPAGHIMLAGLNFTDGVPDSTLHNPSYLTTGGGDNNNNGGSSSNTNTNNHPSHPNQRYSTVTGGMNNLFNNEQIPRFASRQLVIELLTVFGATVAPNPHLSPLAAQLLTLCGDAFMAVRRKAVDIIAYMGSFMPLNLPGTATSYDMACLRSRLFLHLNDAEAHAKFQALLLMFLHLEAPTVINSNGNFIPTSTPSGNNMVTLLAVPPSGYSTNYSLPSSSSSSSSSQIVPASHHGVPVVRANYPMIVNNNNNRVPYSTNSTTNTDYRFTPVSFSYNNNTNSNGGNVLGSSNNPLNPRVQL